MKFLQGGYYIGGLLLANKEQFEKIQKASDVE